MNNRICATAGCGRSARAKRRTCSTCLDRKRKYGDPHFSPWTVADERDVEVIVERRRPAPGLTRLEQRLAARALTRQGVSAEEIARIVCTSPRNVHRWRADDRNGRVPFHSRGALPPAIDRAA